MDLVIGLAIPFLGTTLGAAMVFLMKNKPMASIFYKQLKQIFTIGICGIVLD